MQAHHPALFSPSTLSCITSLTSSLLVRCNVQVLLARFRSHDGILAAVTTAHGGRPLPPMALAATSLAPEVSRALEVLQEAIAEYRSMLDGQGLVSQHADNGGHQLRLGSSRNPMAEAVGHYGAAVAGQAGDHEPAPGLLRCRVEGREVSIASHATQACSMLDLLPAGCV